ncbi:ATP-binding protein [Candidatus Acetothermia bacterium]|nr:ATP-binding protein [Candidatus Acetothermia bacterium]
MSFSRWLRHYTELSIPFVGRALERAELDRAWREAQAGQGCCVLLLGESGVGKTRLAASWFAQLLTTRWEVWLSVAVTRRRATCRMLRSQNSFVS